MAWRCWSIASRRPRCVSPTPSGRPSSEPYYWTAYPEKIDDWIQAAAEAERAAFEQWRRRQKLLASVTRARLLLDEMYHPKVAEQLCKRGHDVVAIVADPDHVRLSDEQVLAFATDDGRCLVAENVRDFEVLRAESAREGRDHAGLLYKSVQRFPRTKRHIGRLVVALEERLTSGRVPTSGQVDWLG